MNKVRHLCWDCACKEVCKHNQLLDGCVVDDMFFADGVGDFPIECAIVACKFHKEAANGRDDTVSED